MQAEPAVVGAQRAVVHKATPKSVSAPSRGAGNAPSKAVHHDDDIDNIVAHMNFDPDSEDTHATCPTCRCRDPKLRLFSCVSLTLSSLQPGHSHVA